MAYKPHDDDGTGGEGLILLVAAAFTTAGGAISLLIILAASTAYNALFVRIGHVPVYIGLCVAFSCLILGAIVFWLRDLRGWRSVALVQIAVAASAGAFAYFSADGIGGRLIGLIAAAVTVANGIKRFSELTTNSSRRSK